MANKTYIIVDGISGTIKCAYIGVNGLARKVKKAYIGIDDVAVPIDMGFRKETDISDFEYEISVNPNTINIIRYIGKDVECVIAEKYKINGVYYDVKTIGDQAFYNCTSLINVVIPSSVIGIEGRPPFEQCSSLVIIEVDNDNEVYKSIDGNLFCYEESGEESGLHLIRYAIGKQNEYFEVPYEVEYINNSAFDGCKWIKSIDLSATLIKIGDKAFRNCTSLKNIEFLGNPTIGSIGSYAFQNCSSLVSVQLPDDLKTIGYYVFDRCTSLKSVVIGNSLTSISSGAFRGCKSLTSIGPINSDASVQIPSSVTSIGGHAFYDCALTNIDIPEGVTNIGEWAFSYCSGLVEAKIPSSVTKISNDVFYDCSYLKRIIFNGYIDEWDMIDKDEYWDENTGEYVISCIDGYITKDGTTEHVRNLEYAMHENNAGYYVTGVGSYNHAESIDIPAEYQGLPVIGIGDNAFTNCIYLQDVYIPDSVNSIGNCAFSGCTSLTDIDIPNSVTQLGGGVFYDCSSLTDVKLGDNITALPCFEGRTNSSDLVWGMFENCTSLVNVDIPNSVTDIGEAAFSYCESLEYIAIPNSVKRINEYTFFNCNSLVAVTIPDSLQEIGSYAFYHCDSLAGITMCNAVYKIEEYAFSNCSSLANVVLGTSLFSMDETVFSECKNLTSVVIKAKHKVWKNVFEGMTQPLTIFVPGSESDYDNAPWGAENATVVYNCDFDNTTTWMLNDVCRGEVGKTATYNIDFISNAAIYSKLVIHYHRFNGTMDRWEVYYGDTRVYVATISGGRWINDAYRTIEILGGEDMDNSNLQSWLSTYAQKIEEN